MATDWNGRTFLIKNEPVEGGQSASFVRGMCMAVQCSQSDLKSDSKSDSKSDLKSDSKSDSK